MDEIFKGKQAPHAEAAAAWFQSLEAALQTLAEFPHRCPAAPENKARTREVRQLLYGSKPHVYRAIFEIKEKRKQF